MDSPRANGVDTDILGAICVGISLGEAEDAMFGGYVGGVGVVVTGADEAVHGGDVDDAATTLAET